MWNAMRCEDVAHRLGVSQAIGLSAAEAAARLAKVGPNLLSGARRSFLVGGSRLSVRGRPGHSVDCRSGGLGVPRRVG
ncbi:MAG: hypothetical protein IT438_05165 [Phycisphaerales bacterium]|nr:hypothetical protein [Phycisphaerales bacterium]